MCRAVFSCCKQYIVYTGKNPTDQYLEAMMNEAPGPINFTMFLTMFGEKLNGTDPEDVIKNAFACFDDENKGTRASILSEIVLSCSADLTAGNCSLFQIAAVHRVQPDTGLTHHFLFLTFECCGAQS